MSDMYKLNHSRILMMRALKKNPSGLKMLLEGLWIQGKIVRCGKGE